ncbi:caspase family protein [Reichenbachiella faecimaris]|nr:caspase family protein [Reichenbachiella faecimaris]
MAQQYSLLPYKQFETSYGQPISTIDLSLDSEQILLTDKKGLLQLWDVPNLVKQKETKSKTPYLLTSFSKAFITLLNKKGELLKLDQNFDQIFQSETGTVPVLATLDPDKKIMSTLTKEGYIELFDLSVNMSYAKMDSRNDSKNSLFIGFDRFGQYIAQISNLGEVRIWNPATQNILKHLKLESGEYHGSKSIIHSATTSKGSNYFIVGLQEIFIPKGGMQSGKQPERRNMLIVYDWDTGNEIKRIKTNDRVDQIVAGPGPETLIYISNDKSEINLINIQSGSLMHRVSTTFKPTILKLSDDNQLLAAGSEDGQIAIFELQRNATAEIKILSPPISRGLNGSQTSNREINLKGTIENIRGLKALTINGREASLNNFGEFETKIALAPGKNKIRIEALDHEQNRIVKDIFLTRNIDPTPNANKSEHSNLKKKKIALVIGNSDYANVSPLANPAKDAEAMEQALLSLGFEVIKLINVGYEEMKNAVFRYGDLIQDVDVSMFYYAGHGLEVDGVNYLVPTDANINSSLDVKLKTIPLTGVLRTIDYANDEGLNMIILDACRNNPFPTGKRGGAGLARETATSGTIIAYATEPGATASDGTGDNGLYTGELVKQMLIFQRIEDVFINTRNNVEILSNGEQKPWEEARLKGVFYLN